MSCCKDHKEKDMMKPDMKEMDHKGHQGLKDHKGHAGHMKEMDHSGHEGHESHMEHKGHGGHMASPHAAKDFLRRFFVVTFLLIPLLLLTKTALSFLGIGDFMARPYLQFTFASVIFYYALVFFQHAKHEIKMNQYGMMTLVSLAVGAGYLFSAASTILPSLKGVEFYLEISTLIWILLFGHYLEARSSTAAGDALDEVAKLLPKKAHLIMDGKESDVDIDALKEGQLVRVKPGEKVPADGKIIEGEANFNEALISGEAKPVVKKKTDVIIAGSICIDGSVLIKLTKVGENSTIGQIKKLIEEAKQTKPSAQSLADRAASILTFVALSVAILTILVWSLILGQSFVFAITLAITVLVIACPHALGLAIPTVTTISTTLAVKNGLFIKDLKKLETARHVDYIVFDKTGTLTEGKFAVNEVVNIRLSKREILEIASSLESNSTHMIGLSIMEYTKSKNIKSYQVTNFKNIAGKGVTGNIKDKKYLIGNLTLMQENKLLDKDINEKYQKLSKEGKTVIFVAEGKAIIGLIALFDQVKLESKRTINSLHKLGIKTAMLTGDSEDVAKAVAKQLDIDQYFAKVLPEKKYLYIKKLQDQGNKVMMVGDGVNDAPALTQADVGVAIGAGTDVAVEAGDVVLTRNNPEDIIRLAVLSRKVYRKMQENIFWALGYNILAIPAAAGLFIPFGFRLRPEIGAILMSLSSVIVVINALTLRRSPLEA